MKYKILADIIVVFHFLWILFMISGFCVTLYSIVFNRKYLDFVTFRVVHLCGIFYVGLLTVLGKYCPVTILEYNLRQKYDSSLFYSGSFIIDWVERIVYPDVHPLLIQLPTIIIAVFTVVIFLIFPPGRKKHGTDTE